MIEFNNVCKSYDGGLNFAVNNLVLRINQGEVLALVGASGCGKTSTLKMVNRLISPSSGFVSILGKNVLDMDLQDLRRNIGYVFQGVGLFPHYNVRQNVATIPSLLNWSLRAIEERCSELLTLVGLPLADFGDRMPRELSGGQQQRVGVARALAAKPEILLMDEPFGALDPINRGELQEEFVRIQKSLKLTVVMVTHDITEAMLIADRIAIMKDGCILQCDTASVLLNDPMDKYVTKLMETPLIRAAKVTKLISATQGSDYIR
jgi:osmoprotectant transport system ATP-binding protein